MNCMAPNFRGSTHIVMAWLLAVHQNNKLLNQQKVLLNRFSYMKLGISIAIVSHGQTLFHAGALMQVIMYL